MIVTYLIPAIFCIAIMIVIVQAIREKKYSNLYTALFLPFFIFFISTVAFGGSAFHDAANHYSLYQEGHYYLCSHGTYTEVSYGIFLYLQIMEIVGAITFGIGVIIALVKKFRYNDQ